MDLSQVHQNINNCHECESTIRGFIKPKPMERGDGNSRIMIIGIAPGRVEQNSGRAFAGQSGTRLENWLVECGANPDYPRRGIYFTSVLKCFAPGTRDYRAMKKNCTRYLIQQINVIKPELIITLGEIPYQSLKFFPAKYSDSIGHIFLTSELTLFTVYDYHFKLLPWPHPSGLNRWLNDRANEERFHSSFHLLTPYLQAVTNEKT